MAAVKYVYLKVLVAATVLGSISLRTTSAASLSAAMSTRPRQARAAPTLLSPHISPFSGFSGVSGFSGLSGLGQAPLWPADRAVLGPRLEPFLIARRSRVPAVLPWRRAAAARARTPPTWPNTAVVHGKDVHWPALRQDGFMLHHAEVNKGHHHHLDFGTQPAENGLIDMMML